MNNREQNIEKTLRQAPRPVPPSDLKKALLSQVELPPARSATPLERPGFSGWLRRWWPTLIPAAASAACAVVVAIQHGEIKELKQAIQTLSENASITPVPSFAAQTSNNISGTSQEPDYQMEIERMKQQAGELKNELVRLENLGAENVRLRSQLAASSLPVELQGAAEDMQKAKEKAQRIACVNNLKQFGLAVKIWAGDNKDIFPPDVLSMKEELSTPKILVCPADTDRQLAPNWESFSTANCSYEYLAPGASDNDPERVLSRCPIHNNVGLCDGSVQSLKSSDSLVVRDGKHYIAR